MSRRRQCRLRLSRIRPGLRRAINALTQAGRIDAWKQGQIRAHFSQSWRRYRRDHRGGDVAAADAERQAGIPRVGASLFACWSDIVILPLVKFASPTRRARAEAGATLPWSVLGGPHTAPRCPPSSRPGGGFYSDCRSNLDRADIRSGLPSVTRTKRNIINAANAKGMQQNI